MDFTLPRPRRSAAHLSPSPRLARTPAQLRPRQPGAEPGARALSGLIGLWTLPTALPLTLLDDRARLPVRSGLPPRSTPYGGGFVSVRIPGWSEDVLLASPRPQAAHVPLVLGRALKQNVAYAMIGTLMITNTAATAHPTGAHLVASASPPGAPNLVMNMVVPATVLFVMRDLAVRVSRPLGWRSAQ